MKAEKMVKAKAAMWELRRVVKWVASKVALMEIPTAASKGCPRAG